MKIKVTSTVKYQSPIFNVNDNYIIIDNKKEKAKMDRRKVCDITKTQEYKEIYIVNLRLYSTLIAKKWTTYDTNRSIGLPARRFRRIRSHNDLTCLNYRHPLSEPNLQCISEVIGSMENLLDNFDSITADSEKKSIIGAKDERRASQFANMIKKDDFSQQRRHSMRENDLEQNVIQKNNLERSYAAKERLRKRRLSIESFEETFEKTNEFLKKSNLNSTS